MRFTKVDHRVMRESQARRQKFLQLVQDVFEKSQEAKEAQMKAKIIQMVISGRLDYAGEVYNRQSSALKQT